MQPADHLGPPTQLKTPVRNRYFYGKLLDTYHFELETGYLNTKRWLINRQVLGYGVVCGLDVVACEAPHTICVTRGLAIDKWGREVIVPQTSDPVLIPRNLLEYGDHGGAKEEPERNARNQARHECFTDLHVVLCYRECESDPAPVLNGTCHEDALCTPGAIREQYRVEIRPGSKSQVQPRCHIKHLFENGQLQYSALANWVTQDCPQPTKDPCLLLANIRVPEGEPSPCKKDWIDITVRSIVYSNDLLFEIINCMLKNESMNHDK